MKKKKHIDLSEVDGSITKILEESVQVINKLKTSQEITDFIEFTFATNGINTPCSQKMVEILKNSKSFNNSLQFIWNTILSGENLGVV